MKNIRRIGIPYGADEAFIPAQKFRDNMKCLNAMTDDTAAYLLLGVEGQSQIHYAMPVKDMVYDAFQYASQVEEAANSHKRAVKARKKDKKTPKVPTVRTLSSGEYLTGFYKEDKLIPVITLVIYFGSEEWDT